ncbi:MAG: galactosyltransferase-related protein [Cyclobacterium sp.]|uniref:galactosyltransferase-related protein n=1 Tax=unclassified Cyclobacterium TaxID=2615055 RepID=UPI0013D1D27E|nr:galactosyltransferase-related protein [Cyclobacterium sp. SYSU L10401]
MEKSDLRDVTFIIPLRIDTVDRLENTLVILDFLLGSFHTRIKILEACRRNTGILQQLLPGEVDYRFVEDRDDVFHRTKYINTLTTTCETTYLSLWDTDVIIPSSQIEATMKRLREGKADFVTPFQDRFLDTSYILRDLYIQSGDIGLLEKQQGKMNALYTPNPVGGVFFAHRQAYVDTGMENERFYGWGREDGDRANRWKILGYRHQHVPGPLFHLSHERGLNSSFHSSSQNDKKMAELQRSLVMSKKELKREIKSWR